MAPGASAPTALALALAACLFAARAFVPTLPAAPAPSHALRGAQAEPPRGAGPGPAAPGAAPWVGLALLAGACAAAARAAPGARRGPARAVGMAAAGAFDPSTEVGVTEPMGFFDPAGFSKAGDREGFRNLRAAEIKHGRVAMMAALGGAVQHYVKIPGFESVPSGMGAVTTPPGSFGFAALFLIAGALELGVWTQDPAKEVGDFGDPLGLGQYDTDMRNRELNNGRFAMFAALGIVAADLYTGKDAIEQFNP